MGDKAHRNSPKSRQEFGIVFRAWWYNDEVLAMAVLAVSKIV
jgi:hypothetical protein